MKRTENWRHSGYYWVGMRHNDARRRATLERLAGTARACSAVLTVARAFRERRANDPLCNLVPTLQMRVAAALAKCPE